MSRFVAKHLQPNQKAWNNATQNRIAATSSLLSALKMVKMLGLQNSLTNRVQEYRQKELEAASKLRWVMVYYNASGLLQVQDQSTYPHTDIGVANALGLFTPALTL